MKDYFKNRKLVIATMHKKESVIKPILERELWVECFVVENFNTDRLWTFTRDIKRKWNMLETARLKINYAMEITWCDLWVSSEWSFWLHSWIPFLNSNFELTLLIDRKNNLEIAWHHLITNTNLDWKYLENFQEALEFAKKHWFPEHWVIIRLSEKSNFFIHKNINDENDLKNAINKILSLPFVKKFYIETDMRAHKNPTRMKNIELSINDLVKNIKSKCPKCESPWFIVSDIERWLPCKICLRPTDKPTFEIYTCKKCNFVKKVKIEKYWEYADPWECENCNP